MHMFEILEQESKESKYHQSLVLIFAKILSTNRVLTFVQILSGEYVSKPTITKD